MYDAAKHIDPYGEVPSALLRAEQRTVRAAPAPRNTAKFIAVLFLGLGVVLADPVAMTASLLLGALALAFTFRREDRAAEDGVESHFDARTGLPLAESLPLIVEDSQVIRSLTGRLAVAAIDVPEIAAHEVAGDHQAAQALLAAMTHRLRSHGWAGDAVGPFGPLIFLRRPGVFLVILRDVLDERTTRWLAERVLAILNEPVTWRDGTIEPGAVLGLAVGDVAGIDNLILAAGDARVRARSGGRELVVHDRDARPTPGQSSWTVECDDAAFSGHMVAGGAADGDLFTEVGNLARRLNETLRTMRDGDHGYLTVSTSTLCHRETRHRILARVNEAGAHGRLGLVVPGSLDDRSFLEAWKTIDALRRAGIDVHIDRTHAATADRPLPAHDLDGVVIDTRDATAVYDDLVASARARGLRVLARTGTAVQAVATGSAQADQGPSTPVISLATEARGTSGPNFEGQADQRPQGSTVVAR